MTAPLKPGARKGTLLVVWILAAIAVGGLIVGYNYMRFYSDMLAKNRNLAPIKEVPGFTMQNQEGEKVTPAKFLGNVWLANFMFTRCPGPCLKLTKEFAKLQSDLPSDVKFASFTVDPDYDSPAVLKKYGIANGADFGRWEFLTADKEQMRHVVIKGFMTTMADQTNPDFAASEGPIIHSTLFALIDQKGRIRKYYDGLTPQAMEEMKSAVQYLQSSAGEEVKTTP